MFFDSETWKVQGAALFGFSAPGLNLFLKNLEPLLNTLILAGQVGVATVTILYIYAKLKKIRGSKPRIGKKK